MTFILCTVIFSKQKHPQYITFRVISIGIVACCGRYIYNNFAMENAILYNNWDVKEEYNMLQQVSIHLPYLEDLFEGFYRPEPDWFEYACASRM